MFSVSIDSWFSVFCFCKNIVMWHMKEIFFINKMKNKKNNLGWVRCFVLEISGL